jgi:hypothetical protein
MPCYYALPEHIIDIISKMVHQMSYQRTLKDIASGEGSDYLFPIYYYILYEKHLLYEKQRRFGLSFI